MIVERPRCAAGLNYVELCSLCLAESGNENGGHALAPPSGAKSSGELSASTCQAEAFAETARRFDTRTVPVPALPQVPQFRARKLAMREGVTSASGCQDKGLRWPLEVARRATTIYDAAGLSRTSAQQIYH